MAKLVFQVQDKDGNLVAFETTEHEGKELVESYAQYMKWLVDNGFTPVKARGGFVKKEKVVFDGNTCPVCKSRVYDNRPKKAEGAYKATAPDFSCSNKACTGGGKGNKWAVWPGQYEIAA